MRSGSESKIEQSLQRDVDPAAEGIREGLHARATPTGEKLMLLHRGGYEFLKKVRRQESQSTSEAVGL